MALSLADMRATIFRSARLILAAKASINAHARTRSLEAASDPGTTRASAEAARAARLTQSSGLTRRRSIVVATPRLLSCIGVRNPARAEVGGEPRAGRAGMGLQDMGEGDATQPRTEMMAWKAVDLGSAGHRDADDEASDSRLSVGATADMGNHPIVGDPVTG